MANNIVMYSDSDESHRTAYRSLTQLTIVDHGNSIPSERSVKVMIQIWCEL